MGDSPARGIALPFLRAICLDNETATQTNGCGTYSPLCLNRGMRDRTGTAVDVLVIGAGPTGLACAIDAQNAGFDTLLVDKGCLCNSLFHYPSNMTFFTTPELLEIGNIPFSSPNQ